MNDELVKGGQGRTAEDLIGAATLTTAIFVMLIGAAVVLAICRYN